MDQEFIPFPNILKRTVDNANERLAILQEVLHKEVMESSLEVMEFLSLNPSDGWKVDLEEKRFVLVNGDTAQQLPTSPTEPPLRTLPEGDIPKPPHSD